MTNIVVVDTETSGVDVFNDRIVTCFIGLMNDGGEFVNREDFLINPGIEIPQGAIDVHGITNERAKAEGLDPKVALPRIRELLQWAIDTDTPIVVYNAPFDLTLINAELERHGFLSLPFTEQAIIVDPLVVDKAQDKYRKGSRKLADTAWHYGLDVDRGLTHSADYDCLLAGRLALHFIGHLPYMLDELNVLQRTWKSEQSASLQRYFRSNRNKNGADPTAVVDGGFPVYERKAA